MPLIIFFLDVVIPLPKMFHAKCFYYFIRNMLHISAFKYCLIFLSFLSPYLIKPNHHSTLYSSIHHFCTYENRDGFCKDRILMQPLKPTIERIDFTSNLLAIVSFKGSGHLNSCSAFIFFMVDNCAPWFGLCKPIDCGNHW